MASNVNPQITEKTINGYSYPVVETLPNGWKESTAQLTNPKGYTWVDNGKSRFAKDITERFRHALIKTSELKAVKK